MERRNLFHRKFSLTLLFSLLFILLQAQPVTFLKTYNQGNSGFTVREVNGNSYVVAGGTDYYYNFHWLTMTPIAGTNVQLLKTTSNGSLLWEKIYSKPGWRTQSTWMEHTQDDGFILTGRANHDVTWPPDSNDILLIKTDAVGNIQWSKFYDTGKDDVAFCVQQTNDGGYIMSAFHDAAPVSLTGTTYAMLIKTDANGTLQWNKKYELAVRDLDTGEPLTWTVRQTANGGYILGGTTAGSHAADVYVIRTNSTGDVIWAKSYEHDSSVLRFSLALDIMENNSGDFIIAGSMDKDQSLNLYNYPYILKISSAGTILDLRFYDSNPVQTFQSGFSSVEQTPDGGYFFTGMGGYSGLGFQAQLLKTDANFNMEWSRAYTSDGATTMGARSGRSTSDGCYIVTGRKVLAGTVLMKTDPFGMVPCKTPGSLVELAPAIFVQDRFPATLSGINESTVVFNTLTGLNDTTAICPEIIVFLPVELLTFEGRRLNDGNTQLNWVTASESNNDYFKVERSPDGINFSTAGIVKGNGTTSVQSNYELVDKNLADVSLLYYKLAQVDFNGNTHYSKTIAITKRPGEFALLSASGNREQNSILIQMQTGSSGKLKVEVYDVNGKKQISKIISSTPGLNTIHLDNPFLPEGIYYISISTDFQVAGMRIFY